MSKNEYSELAKKEAKEFLEKHPEHKEEVEGLFLLMQDEINEGGSPSSEYESFIQSIEDLLEEK